MGFPLVRQRDAKQCGIACLAMVSRYWGRKLSLEELERVCTVTREGVSMLAISRTASELGLENVTVKLTLQRLGEIPLPCILHWKQNHFVVLYKVSKNGKRFYIADPGKGLRRCSVTDMENCWLVGSADKGLPSGVVMLFHPIEGFCRDCREKVENERSLGFLMGYMLKFRSAFIQIFVGLLLGCLLQLILPFLTQAIVDTGIKNRDIGFIWLVLLGELMIVLGRTATDFIRRWLLLHISVRVNMSLISDFFIKLLRLPMSYFDSKLTGDLIQRISDHSRVQSFLTGQTLNILFSLLSFVVFGIVLLVYDKLIFCIFIAGSLAYGVWISIFLKRRKVIDYELFEQMAINQDKTYQFLTAMQEIKLQDCERRRRWEWEDVQADLFTVQMKSLKLEQTQEAGSVFINEVKNIVITVFAATAVINGALTLGGMLAVQYIIGQLNSPVSQLMSFIYSLQDVKISLERINEIHCRRNEENDDGSMCSFPENTAKDIVLDRVVFRYDRHSLKDTISDVSIEIPSGKVTAIVGASGCGKTTLVKLMLGYYPVLGGSIRIAGRDISSYSLKWWRRQCGVVMQEGFIFSESIERNIAVDDGEIDRERLESAARIANIHDYIMSLPLKYDTKIGAEGNGLSQGQRQRILIARAVYRNPSFIFLDEATNSLDASNEREIVENLDRFYRGRTVVVVAHRLSTVRNADKIVVMDSGRVVETGTHDELVARRGHYYNLVRNQLELGA